MTSGQRGWKRQPPGGRARSGGAPGIPASSRRGPVTDGNALIKPRVYGCSGRSKIASVSAASATWPAYITSTRSE